jgi:uncharacterized protein
MYTGADASWRTRPALLSDPLAAKLLARVREHVEAHPARGVTLELHGGEPLLWGRDRVRRFAREAAAIDRQRVEVTLQTNGTLLDAAWLDLFADEGISFSVSCDGPPALHDARRPTLRGAPTAGLVERAIREAIAHERARELFGGVLSVADLGSDPREPLRYFHALGVRALDLLLPDLTRREAAEQVPAARAYLTRAFDAWLELGDAEFNVRFLAEFALGVLGVRSPLDYLGGDLSDLLVIESDGSVQLHDVLRVCASDAAAIGMHLDTHSLAEAAAAAAAAAPRAPATCVACPAFGACGGGFPPHRYEDGSFDHPSGYCGALYGLYEHVLAALRRATPASCWRPAPARPAPA